MIWRAVALATLMFFAFPQTSFGQAKPPEGWLKEWGTRIDYTHCRQIKATDKIWYLPGDWASVNGSRVVITPGWSVGWMVCESASGNAHCLLRPVISG